MNSPSIHRGVDLATVRARYESERCAGVYKVVCIRLGTSRQEGLFRGIPNVLAELRRGDGATFQIPVNLCEFARFHDKREIPGRFDRSGQWFDAITRGVAMEPTTCQ